MIQARPKVGTLFSIIIFLIIAYAVFIYVLLGQDLYDTWSLILIFTVGPIAIAITFKTFWGIKFIDISKEKFVFKYPFRFSTIKFNGKELESWKLEKIKTYGGEYEELILKTTTGRKYTISKQEHTNYDKALNYMIKKFKKIRV